MVCGVGGVLVGGEDLKQIEGFEAANCCSAGEYSFSRLFSFLPAQVPKFYNTCSYGIYVPSHNPWLYPFPSSNTPDARHAILH